MIHTEGTVRVRAVYERMAGGYDRMIATWERLLFDDGRRWARSQAQCTCSAPRARRGPAAQIERIPQKVISLEPHL